MIYRYNYSLGERFVARFKGYYLERGTVGEIISDIRAIEREEALDQKSVQIEILYRERKSKIEILIIKFCSEEIVVGLPSRDKIKNLKEFEERGSQPENAMFVIQDFKRDADLNQKLLIELQRLIPHYQQKGSFGL